MYILYCYLGWCSFHQLLYNSIRTILLFYVINTNRSLIINKNFEYYFGRYDESNDELFYQNPRFVVHIDDGAIILVKGILQDYIKDNAVVLDLMSSWRTHWPEGKPKESIVGLGLNAEEMADNPDLDYAVVHNLNENPKLPFDDGIFDAVLMTVSVQYLINPFKIFQEVSRVLKSKGVFIVTFSNRMFPTKAVNIWKETDEISRMQLVEFYMERSEGFDQTHTQLINPEHNYMEDPLYLVLGYSI